MNTEHYKAASERTDEAERALIPAIRRAQPPYPATCQHCQRSIILRDGIWIDPNANGDDEMWKETCDSHDTFTAEHEPKAAQ